MALRVSGKNLDIGEALRQQIVDRVSGAVRKFFDGGFQGHVTVERDGTAFRTDCALHLASGVTLQVDSTAHDPYLSADRASERLESRLRRYKQRLKGRSPVNGVQRTVEVPAYVIQAPDEADEEIDGEFHPLVIAETKKSMRTLSVSEAVMDLDLTGAPVVVFRHAGSERVNMVYRRSDGNIGWIDPPALAPGDGQ
ncbi:ribosome-associated translation inhibitor RaiA [Alsobacter sp. SYSU M60028]|uniref:Ribosome hibernation promoting factor n=1 Tax=Alsobacter ponti TaxID=2962936 RepID=A0ABT1LBG4_9HYPH|nr:ribosome-associated translation inhibitor RaiA [Alsobacter ponti]MCP8938830.1 ribosome-associated translation inhibitor RaiA [Alsobacter ponti]